MIVASHKRRGVAVVGALLAVAAAGAVGTARRERPADLPLPANHPQPRVSTVVWVAPAPPPAEAPSRDAAALIVDRDPKTGRFGVPPPEVVRGELAAGSRVTLEQLQRRAAGRKPLVESPGRSAAGGFRVHLDNRFGAAMVATRDAGGHLSVRCETVAAAPAPAAARAGRAGRTGGAAGGPSRKEE
jgi:hypothetical protein